MPMTESPLRYPGGKTQLTAYVEYLLKLNKVTDTYIEPFAGGFGVGLKLLKDNAVRKVVINDFDASIYSIWYTILNNTDLFIKKIKETPVTIEEWYKQKKIREKCKDDCYSIDNAFASFFLNRTNVSGIINGGPIGGKAQNGKYKINCRFNKSKLIKKISTISQYRERIRLTHMDANDFIKKEILKYNPNSTFIFFDPPYYKQGKNLYLSFVNPQEHKRLSENILNLDKYKWITTYDIEDEILRLYKPYVKVYTYSLNYSANHKRKANEFMFVNNGTNVRSFDKVRLLKVTDNLSHRY